MKRYFIFLVLLMLLPKVCLATTISSFSMSKPESANVGDKIKLNVTIKFSELDKKSANTEGIISIGYKFQIDEDILEIVSITSNSKGLDTEYQKKDDYYLIEADVNDTNVDRCLDGITFCNDYSGTITLKVKDTTSKSTTIGYNDASAVVINTNNLKDIDENTTLNEYLNALESSTKIITQKKSSPLWIIWSIKINQKKENNPTTETSPKVPSSQTNTTNSDKDKIDTKSNNKIKDFVIKGYALNFKPNQKTYDLTVEKDVNKLEIIIKLENSEAQYEIIGADDLKSNNNEIIVNVTAPNKDKNTYTVKVHHDENEAIIKKEEEPQKFHLEKEQLINGGIGLGIALFFLIILGILIHIKNKKENKKYDEL